MGCSSSASKRTGETRIKNVYLLGGTGEGKSSLGNVLTEDDTFATSHSGTGTLDMSYGIMKIQGSNQSVRIWDTPGMNDQNGMDSTFQVLLEKKIKENGTVSAVVILSKDGSRLPRSLLRAISSYRDSFGEAFMRGLCLCIGLNEQKLDPDTVVFKRKFWTRSFLAVLHYKLGKERIFFYNALDEDHQPELIRLKEWVSQSETHLIGVGQTIFQSLIEMKEKKETKETKTNIRLASEEMRRSVVKLVSSNEVRKFDFTEGKYGHGIYFSLTPINTVSMQRRYNIGLTTKGKKAADFLKSMDRKQKDLKESKKERLLKFIKLLDLKTFALIEMAHETVPDKAAEIVDIHLVLWDMKTELGTEMSMAIELALQKISTKARNE
ncbi:50S ribosome-binding GTPase [Gracilaria domingensis]|nr:50S ribosome-binding GTPase [Gracilaria domingensis]